MEFFFNPATGRVEQRQVDNNLPFRSMTDMASEINQFPFLSPNPTTPLDPFKNTVAPMAVNTGIPSTSAAFSFQDFYNPIYDPYNPEKDDEQVDYIGNRPNKIQTGIAKLFEFLQRFSPTAIVGRGIDSLRNRIDTRRAIQKNIDRDTQGTLNTIISPRILNIKPTAQDIARGGGSIPTKTTSKRTSPQGGMQAERTRSRDLGRMRGGVGR